MLNTRDLERRWLKYKIKSFLPYGVIILSLTVITVSISFYISSTNTVKVAAMQTSQAVPVEKNNSMVITSIAPEKENIQPVPAISNIVNSKTTTTTPSQQQEDKVVLKPSLDFMKKIQSSSDGYYQNSPREETFNTTYVSDTPKVKKTVKKPIKQTVVIEDVKVEEEPASQPEKAKKILIAKNTSLQDIRDAEKRFKQNNSPALSLFLAKQYYSLENYSKSYNYALITNQLDKTNEDSWLIFSRSLVKLGKPELAKKALREYIKFSHSSNAELLLDDITTGKFQ